MRIKILFCFFFVLSVTLISLNPAFAGEIDDLKKQIETKEAEIQELQERAKQYEETLDEKRNEAETLEDRIIGFNRQIASLENDIVTNEQVILSLNLRIKKTEIQIQAQEESIARTKKQIVVLMQEMYIGEEESMLELLLKYENFSEFYDQINYRDALYASLDIKLNEVKLFRESLEDERVQLTDQKKELEELRRDLAFRKQIVKEQRGYREDLLRKTRNEESRYHELFEDAQAKEAEAQRQIFELEDALRRSLNPDLVPQAIPGVLSWPAEGLFTQGYGCLETRFARASYPPCNDGRGGFHNGIDIAASVGTPIRASRDGTVLVVENAPYAYGKWIAVEHDNGLVTLYPHLSVQAAKTGQQVKRGETVGYMGSSGYSTGSHLHFTVYAPKTFTTKLSKLAGILPIGATLNPFNYLP